MEIISDSSQHTTDKFIKRKANVMSTSTCPWQFAAVAERENPSNCRSLFLGNENNQPNIITF